MDERRDVVGRNARSVHWAPRPARPSGPWLAAKWAALGVFLAFLIGAAVRPETAARLFWFGLVPALPAVFLVNAEIWRNVCPLATLNTISGEDTGLPLDRRLARISTVVGVAVLFLAIPARSWLFHGSGAGTGLLVGGAGLAALASGFRYQRKAGFCNAVCPLLPVERLYGQSPMVVVENARCTPCHVCTRAACFDLNPGRSALQTLQPRPEGRRWVLLPFGIFALAFPGVILAFYQLPVEVAAGWRAYATVAAGGGLSWLIGAGVVADGRVRPAPGLLAAAALSAAVYYWHTPTGVAGAFGWAAPVEWSLRAAALTLVGWWTVRAWPRLSR